MPANIASTCSDCCTCPTPTMELAIRQVEAYPCGYVTGWGVFGKVVMSGSVQGTRGFPNAPGVTTWSSETITTKEWVDDSDPADTCPPFIFYHNWSTSIYQDNFGYGTCVGVAATGVITDSGPLPVSGDKGVWFFLQARPATLSPSCLVGSASSLCPWVFSDSPDPDTPAGPSTAFVRGDAVGCSDGTEVGDYLLATFSQKLTIAELESRALARLATKAYGSFQGASLTVQVAIKNRFVGLNPYVDVYESRYRWRFKLPTSGTAYRLTWLERFIPAGGVAVSAVDVASPGVYRPNVSISAPPSGGVQARAIAVMSPTGGVAEIKILNPGAGYLVAPTISLTAATAGGTTATGWTATISGGRVVSISGGAAGNYRPTLTFSSGGGTGATALAVMDEQGGIGSVSLTSGGSGFSAAPALLITSRIASPMPAVLHVRLGTETTRCAVWTEGTPAGYDSANSATWPTLPAGAPGYFSVSPPAEEGLVTLANLRVFCDGSSC